MSPEDDTKQVIDLPVEDKTPDLEALRDEKCVPVARNILGIMATDLIPKDANDVVDYRPVALKVLTEFFTADLVIATEASYVPQLLLGVLSGLNQTAQMCDTLPIDDVRYGGISRKILEIVATTNVRMTDVTKEMMEEDFAPVKEQLNKLFAEEKLNRLELKYVMDNIFDSFTALNNLVSQSLESSSARAEAKLFGIDSMDELTVRKLDEVLKS